MKFNTEKSQLFEYFTRHLPEYLKMRQILDFTRIEFFLLIFSGLLIVYRIVDGEMKVFTFRRHFSCIDF